MCTVQNQSHLLWIIQSPKSILIEYTSFRIQKAHSSSFKQALHIISSSFRPYMNHLNEKPFWVSEAIVILFHLQVYCCCCSFFTCFPHSQKVNVPSAFHINGEWFYIYFSYIRPSVIVFVIFVFRCRRGGVVPFIPAALAFIYLKFE